VWRKATAVAVRRAGPIPPAAVLVTLVRADVPMTASSIALGVGSPFDFGSLGVSVGDSVTLDGATLEVRTRVGTTELIRAGIGGAEPYDGLVRHTAHGSCPEAVEWVRRAARAHRDASRGGGSLSRVFSEGCDAILGDLERGAGREDVASTRRAAGSLVGLGPGLTPAGDDALCGFMLGRWMAGNYDRPVDLALRGVALSSGGRTSDVSAVQLALAGEGRFGEALLSVAEALEARSSTLLAATERCLGEGATSGADALLGLVAGVRSTSRVLARMDA